jgi:hypothetical protein
VASFYYLQHTTMSTFTARMHPDMTLLEVLQVRCPFIAMCTSARDAGIIIIIIIIIIFFTLPAQAGLWYVSPPFRIITQSSHARTSINKPFTSDNMIGRLLLLSCLQVLCAASEFDELPVRHNEDQLNADMAAVCRHPPPMHTVDDPHTKALLLLQVDLCMLLESDTH